MIASSSHRRSLDMMGTARKVPQPRAGWYQSLGRGSRLRDLRVNGQALVVAAWAIAMVAVLCSVCCAQDAPAPQRVILNGPVFVTGKGAAKPLPAWMLELPPVHPLSQRAEKVKSGLARPVTPSATKVQVEPPLPPELTSGPAVVNRQATVRPLPRGLIQPAPAPFLSEPAQQIKKGLALPIVPEAAPITAGLPPAGNFPSLGTNFEGIDEFDQGFGNFPPDGGLGVGPLYIVQITNSHIAYFTKDGAKTFEADPTSFFGSASQLVDPTITYDPLSGRFFFAEFNRDNVVFAAASISSDPNDGWCVYSTTSGIPSGTGIDFTQMGVSDTTETVSLNMNNGQNLVYFFNKANMTSCASNADGVFVTKLTHCDGSTNIFSLRPARMRSFNDTEYLVGTDSNNDVTVWRAFDPVGPSQAFSRACVSTGTYSPPPNAPQPNDPATGAFPLETGDERALSVVERNSHLFVAHNGAGGSCSDTGGSCSTLFFKEIDVSSFPTLHLVQDVFFNVTDFHLFYPAIDVDPGNQMGIASSWVSKKSNRYAGAIFTSGQVSPPLGRRKHDS